MNDKELEEFVQEWLRRVCLICNKKVHDHSVNEVLSCMNKLESHKGHLNSWLQELKNTNKAPED